MTVETIVGEMDEQVKRLGQQVTGRSDLRIGEAVALAAPLVMAFGRLLVAWLCELGSRYERAECPGCGRPMRRHGRRQRTLMTGFGAVRVGVPRLRCRGCRREVAPLLERSELRGGCTPEVWSEAVELATEVPYRRVEEVLGRHGMEVSDSTVEALVKEVGGELAAAETAQAEATERRLASHRAVQAPERLYVSVDGRSARVSAEWRELKVGVVYETAAREWDEDGRPPAAERIGSFAHFGSVEEFCKRFYVELERRGVFQAQEVVLVADGAEWIWQRVRALLPVGTRVVEILDFYHAAENLAKAVTAVYGEGTAAGQECFRRLRWRLKTGQRRAVMALLRELGARAPSADAEGTVNRVLGYFRQHWERIRYLEFRSQGYHIGSGVVESQCKRLGQRVKGPGMNWHPAGLAALLAVDNERQRQQYPSLALAA